MTRSPSGREAYKGRTRKRSNEAGQGIGGGHSTEELRENRREGRAAALIRRTKQGKAAGLPPQGKAQPRKTPRMAPSAMVQSVHDGYSFIVDVDLKSYFDTISPTLSNIFLHEVDRPWCRSDGVALGDQQQPNIPSGGLGRSERIAMVAPAHAAGRR